VKANFHASLGWFEKCMKQVSSYNVKRIEDSASAHHMAGDKYPLHCKTINKEYDYVPQYILKLNKAGLF
jgi:hypothetical protein